MAFLAADLSAHACPGGRTDAAAFVHPYFRTNALTHFPYGSL
jgi:hypothetical protein